jgi:hypothetical protein
MVVETVLDSSKLTLFYLTGRGIDETDSGFSYLIVSWFSRTVDWNERSITLEL